MEDIASGLSGTLLRSGAAPMSAPLKLASGSVALPGLTFQVSPSTGFYKTNSGIGVAVGGVNVAEFLPGGVKGARLIGELIPYTGSLVPALWVLPAGQTLNRAAYPDLWAFAQAEIATGTSFYNNGNGSTTFGIGDLRGRVPVANDALGGVAAGRTTASTMTPSGTIIGAAGGSQALVLSATQIPSVSFSGATGNDSPDHSHPLGGTWVGGVSEVGSGPSSPPAIKHDAANIGPNTGGASIRHQHPFSGSTTGGGTAVVTMQPSLITNYLLYAGA